MVRKKKNDFITDPPKNLLPEHTDAKEAEAKTVETVVNSEKEAVNMESKPDAAVEENKTENKQTDTEIKASDSPLQDKDLVKDPTTIIEEQKKDNPPTVINAEEKVKSQEIPPVQEVSPPLQQDTVSVPMTDIETPKSPGIPAGKAMVIAGSILMILVLLVVGIWRFNSQAINDAKKMTSSVKSAEPTKPKLPVTKTEPTKIASEEVKLNKYPIRVLNGSGVAGEATKVKEILEKEGFKVSQTGNADNYSYTETEIKAKKNVEKSFLDKLNALLSKYYTVAKETTATSSGSSQLEVIVGSEKAK